MSNISPVIDYDNICEAVGIRVADGDHIVKAAVTSLKFCTSLKDLVRKANSQRSVAVKKKAFLSAFIYDTISRQAELELENE